MKKYERLNLKSDIYKQRKSKSPFTSNNNGDYSQNNNNKKLYQNVCCPNCRYLFKVIKQQIVHKMSSTSTIQKIKQPQTITAGTQTQQFFRGSQFKDSPKKQSIKTQKTPFRKIFEITSSRNKYQQSLKVSRNLQRSSITPNKKNKIDMRSSYINKTNKEKQQQLPFPSRTIYTQQKTQSQPRIFSRVSNLKSSRQISDQINENQTNQQINQLIDRIYLSEQIKQILNYNMNQSPQVSMPSYCKMLLYDFMDRSKQKKIQK